MNILSELARARKIRYFLKSIPRDAHILEVGSGTGWVSQYLKKNGYSNYANIDLDWVMQILEFLKLNQKRTSPHDCLVYLKRVSQFTQKQIRIVGFLSQWGIFTK